MNSRQITFNQFQSLIEEYNKEHPVVNESDEDPFDAIQDIFKKRDEKKPVKDNVIRFPLERVRK